jgi:hypothetical protein
MLYLSIIRRTDPDRKLYLAVDHETHASLFAREGIRAALEDCAVARVVVDVTREEVLSWIA